MFHIPQLHPTTAPYHRTVPPYRTTVPYQLKELFGIMALEILKGSFLL